jgi:hypothetical protein
VWKLLRTDQFKKKIVYRIKFVWNYQKQIHHCISNVFVQIVKTVTQTRQKLDQVQMRSGTLGHLVNSNREKKIMSEVRPKNPKIMFLWVFQELNTPT